MTPKEELYNLNEDPYEMNNLASNSKYNKQLEKLRAIYDSEVEKWKEERIEGHAYEIYDKLFDRSLAWSEKDGLMKPEKDNSKKLAAKEAEKAKRKAEKKKQGKKNKKNK